MELIRLMVNAIGTLLYMCCRSFSSSSSVADSVVADSAVADSVVADSAAVADSAVADSVVADSAVADSVVANSAVADSVVADSTAVADDDDADIPPCQEKYDVFISFRGEDTRRTFTSHLHAALLAKKITTYIDDKLERGDEIKPALRKAIEESELSVIIFSKDYASSTWCLDELVHILECKEKRGQLVIPIFYDTLPSDVRRQRGSYALDLLKQRFENRIDKVRKWRAALTNAADMSGFDSKNYRKDADLVKDVVEDIWTKLCRETSCDLEEYVGIESRIKQIESLLGVHSQDACITVGIWGMGGIGKTTLAETVFHKLSSKFDASCFLRNVTEREQKDGLDHLEKTLLKEILKEEGLSIGSTRVRQRLVNTKVLIVLDDVSSPMQMERLAGNLLRYGTGSRIIFTSRDKSTLGQAVEEGKIYAIGGLKWDDAIQLFCSRAFKNNSTCGTDYMGLAIKALDYAGGVPLALILLGSSFRNCKSKEAWEEELEKLKEFPNENIQRVLRLSYDGLGRYEKEIFLDIACFHKRRDVDEVEKVLAIRGRFAATGIRVLVDMSLISIDSRWDGDRTIRMHDLLEEMGRTIVQEQRIEDPHKGNRLFKDEDVYRVLKSNKETPNVEAVLVNWSKIQEPPLNRADFKKMSNLRLLIVDNFDEFGNCCKFTASLDLPDSLCYLYWPHYPLESLPSNFSSENLLELHMPNGKVKKLWEEDQILVNLEVIDLHDSQYLIEAPNLSGSLKIVNINLSGCARLVQIPGCFQHLHKLTHLRFGHCTSLKYLPEMPGSIKYLDLQSSGIKELPKSVWSNENISYLNTSHCKDLEKLPSNRCKLKVSGCFNLDGCTSLSEFSELPRDISKLSLVDCKRLEKFPEILEPMEHMVSLSLRGTAVEMLPSSVGNLISLQTLDLSGCKHLVSLPTNICKLKYLEELNLSGCSELEKFPEILEPMEHLVSLSLQGTAVGRLPSSIGNLIRLQTLYLSGCKHLKDVETSLDLYACPEFKKLPSSSLGSLSLKGFVGIESRIKQIELLLGIHSQDACITVGIWGMGGIGKTTLAETIFHKLSSKFEASCFLRNVREREQKDGLEHLQSTLVSQILKEEGLSIGSTLVRERLSRTKVLIVLDDVSSSIQMKRLAGDRLRYGTGSRIIITSRHRGTLRQTVEEDNIYEVEVLKPDDALQLFCSRAFKNKSTRRTDYKQLTEKAVAYYAQGVPLALTVLGSLFFNCKSKEEWEDEFNKLKRFPSEDIQKMLRISYDRLGENEKEIFLEIACFHKGKSVVEVKRMLDVRGFFATPGIRILIEMSLISIDSEMETIEMDDLLQEMGRETIEMHDLLQEMGWKIVQEQGIKDPGKRSRLFNDEDVYRVLRSKTETPNVEGVQVDWYNLQERPLKRADFKKMSNLIMLIVDGGYKFNAFLDLPDSLRYLNWFQYPLESLPSNFSPENLVELHMPGSQVKKLWKEEQRLVNLQVIDMHDSRYLTEVPNLFGSLKIVNINLRGCVSLVEIPRYFQHLDKLTRLDLGGCTGLKYLPEMPGNIQYLNLQYSGLQV